MKIQMEGREKVSIFIRLHRSQKINGTELNVVCPNGLFPFLFDFIEAKRFFSRALISKIFIVSIFIRLHRSQKGSPGYTLADTAQFPFLFDFIEAKSQGPTQPGLGYAQFPFLFDFIEAKRNVKVEGDFQFTAFPFLFDFIEAKSQDW